MISSLVLSPTASAHFSSGAWVQPQPGLMRRIFRLSVPVECSQKTWLTLARCGTIPKSNFVSFIVSLAPEETSTCMESSAGTGLSFAIAVAPGAPCLKTTSATIATATATSPEINQMA